MRSVCGKSPMLASTIKNENALIAGSAYDRNIFTKNQRMMYSHVVRYLDVTANNHKNTFMKNAPRIDTG